MLASSRCGGTVRKLVNKALRISKDYTGAQVVTHASSTAYFFFTAIIPIIIIVVCIVSFSGITEHNLVGLAEHIVPDTLMESVEGIIHDAYANSGLALTVSVVTLLWTASKGITALGRGLNAAYGEKEHRGLVRRAIVSLIAVAVLILLLAAALYLIFSDVIMHMLTSILRDLVVPDELTTLLRTAIVFGFAITVFALCYTYLPAGARRLREQVPGAVLTGVSWLVFSYGFRIYVDNSTRFTVLYGSLATVALLLLWLYWLFLILLVGALFNRYRTEWFNKPNERPNEKSDGAL